MEKLEIKRFGLSSMMIAMGYKFSINSDGFCEFYRTEQFNVAYSTVKAIMNIYQNTEAEENEND